MKFLKINFLFAAFVLLSFAFISCEDDSKGDRPLTDFVGLEEARVIEILPSESAVLQTKVYATPSSTDRTVQLYFDASTTADLNYVSMPSSITIPAGATEVPFEISIENYGLTAGGKLIRIGIEKQEGINIVASNSSVNANASDAFGVKLFTITARDFCPYNSVNLSITFDSYPVETAWELYDSNFNVIASAGIDAAGVITGFPGQTTYKTDFCLESGDYTFVIYDDYGDGMYTSAAIQGTYVLKFGQQILATGTGDFGAFQDTAFTLP